MKPVADLVSIDHLDDAIVNLSAHINSETYELLLLIRQFDERAGWLSWGLGNCAEWLHFRCDFSMNASREKVRVAHALKILPEISAAFANGSLSYSKVRAMTRVVGSHNEQELLSFALATTTARVEERCRELRCGMVDSLSSAQRAFANRSLRVIRTTLIIRRWLGGTVGPACRSKASNVFVVTVIQLSSAKTREANR